MHKQIFIHIGPAKTGSSAIQKFMLENPVLLNELGIFYPKHTLMESGVSTGNWSALFAKNEKRKPSKQKIEKLLAQFENSKARVLLLSSENFFGRIQVLAEVMPTAKFIFYLRNPLSSAESLYNQNVKNFGETEPFEIKTRRPNFGTIGHLRNFVQTYGREKVILRYFHPTLFYRRNILNDILTAMGIDYSADIVSQKVNLSYTFEALETKRFLNNFKLGSYCDYILDNLLQQNQNGNLSYSLLSPPDFTRHLQHVEDELHLFFKKIPCEKSNQFLETIRHTTQKKFIAQEISEEEFVRVRNFIFKKNKPLYYELCTRIHQEKQIVGKLTPKIRLFTEKYKPKVRLLLKTRYEIDKLIFINKLRINKLKS